MTDLKPIIEPETSHWRDLLDAYERSAQVYVEEADTLDPGKQRDMTLHYAVQHKAEADRIREEHRVALAHEGLVDQAMAESERSLYAQEKRFGVSDIGGCRRYVQFLIEDEPFSDPRGDFLAAYIGTEVGRGLERDYVALRNPHALTQMTVTVPIEVVVEGEVFQINLPGHPDEVEPAEHGNVVNDYKTKDGLGVVIREDGEHKHKFQVTLYAKALIRDGVITDKARLAITYVDRSGAEQEPHVVEWDYDEAIYEEAVEWLSDVIYAVHMKEEASRDMPRQWCESYCPFFTVCRGRDTDVEGVITDPYILATIEHYDTARAEITALESVKKAAAAELKGVAGHLADGRVLRWVHVNETKIETYTRRAYEKIDLTRPKRKP